MTVEIAWVENIILGIAANGLTAILATIGREVWQARPGAPHPAPARPVPTASGALQLALSAVARRESAERVKLFLVSPEAETIARQLHSALLSGKAADEIKQEFISSFSLYTQLAPEESQELGGQLFDSLQIACQLTLESAIEQGSLSAHEANAWNRQRRILDELASVKRNLEHLSALHRAKPDIDAILGFENQYREQLRNRHGFITPPHIDTARKIPLDALFVAPLLRTKPTRKTVSQSQSLSLTDFLASLHRAVVLGNPGGGKSTLASKVCVDLASAEPITGGRRITPALVVLRDYGVEKKTRSCSILEYIATSAKVKYQVEAPLGAFDYLLSMGRCMVIFDGLDELIETAYRKEIADDVESFCNLYPATPILVTSREVGYDQAPLDTRRFAEFRLAPFSDEQVSEYVRKWFAVDDDLGADEARHRTDAFLAESELVSDLRTNPLMLALMCTIYRGENYIPRNRPDVYEKCTTMLFEKWDKGRGIKVPLPIDQHIRPTMMHLASWMHSDETVQSGASEERLVHKAAEYLLGRRFDDQDAAEAAAREFITFCRGRAWVFSDAGTMPDGERLYQFTHRTFLEYFAAAHLVRMNRLPEDLSAKLLPRVRAGEWDVVAQLAVQLQNKNLEGAGDHIIDTLALDAARANGTECWNVISFAARCLAFLVPAPRTVRRLVETIVDKLVRSKYTARRDAHLVETALSALVSCADENLGVAMNSLREALGQNIRATPTRGMRALDVLLSLPCTTSTAQGNVNSEELTRLVLGEVSSSAPEALRRLAEANPSFCGILAIRGVLPVSKLFEWHGVPGLFHEPKLATVPVTFISNAVRAVIHLTSEDEPQSRQLVESLGGMLRSSPVPWLKKPAQEYSELHYITRLDLGPRYQAALREASPAARFATLAVLAVLIERELLGSRQGKHDRLSDPANTLLSAWRDRSIVDLARLVADLGVTGQDADLLFGWARHEISFVSRAE